MPADEFIKILITVTLIFSVLSMTAWEDEWKSEGGEW